MPQRPTSRRQILIAVVDDDISVREAMTGLMRSLGFSTEAFPSADALLSSERIERIDCLILDMQMPGGPTGLELYERLLFCGRRIPAVLITAFPDEPTRARALAIGLPYLTKPVDDQTLLTAIRAMLRTNTDISRNT